MMKSEQVFLHGLTTADIQKAFEEVVDAFPHKQVGIVCMDAVYLYTFPWRDFEYVKPLVRQTRTAGRYVWEENRWVFRNPAMVQWHQLLERWYQGQTVVIDGRDIRPDQIQRNIDRIVNEGLETLAMCLMGEGARSFKYSAIGKGTGLSQAFPNDTALKDEVSRVDVRKGLDGGSLTRDGSTIYNVGHHSRNLESFLMTESAVLDGPKPATPTAEVIATVDRMLDHSVFPNGVQHDRAENSPGVSTIVYNCGL